MVGEIVKIGQSVGTTEGQNFFADCIEEVKSQGISNNRFVKMWGCTLYCARKVSKQGFDGYMINKAES